MSDNIPVTLKQKRAQRENHHDGNDILLVMSIGTNIIVITDIWQRYSLAIYTIFPSDALLYAWLYSNCTT